MGKGREILYKGGIEGLEDFMKKSGKGGKAEREEGEKPVLENPGHIDYAEKISDNESSNTEPEAKNKVDELDDQIKEVEAQIEEGGSRKELNSLNKRLNTLRKKQEYLLLKNKSKIISQSSKSDTVANTDIAVNISSREGNPKKKKFVVMRGSGTKLADDEKDVITGEDLEELDKDSKRIQSETVPESGKKENNEKQEERRSRKISTGKVSLASERKENLKSDLWLLEYQQKGLKEDEALFLSGKFSIDEQTIILERIKNNQEKIDKIKRTLYPSSVPEKLEGMYAQEKVSNTGKDKVEEKTEEFGFSPARSEAKEFDKKNKDEKPKPITKEEKWYKDRSEDQKEFMEQKREAQASFQVKPAPDEYNNFSSDFNNEEKKETKQLTLDESFEKYKENERLKGLENRNPSDEEAEKMKRLWENDPNLSVREYPEIDASENIKSKSTKEFEKELIHALDETSGAVVGQKGEINDLNREKSRTEEENKELKERLLVLEPKLSETEKQLEEEIEKNASLQEKKGIVAFLKKNKKNIFILSGLVGVSAATGGLAGAGYALGSAGLGELVRRKIAGEEEKNPSDENDADLRLNKPANKKGYLEKVLDKVVNKYEEVFLSPKSNKEVDEQEKEKQNDVEKQEKPEENKIDKSEAEKIQESLEQIDVFMNRLGKGEVSGEAIYTTAVDLTGWMKSEQVSRNVKIAVQKKLYDMDPNIQAKMVSSMLEFAMAKNMDKAETFENLMHLTTKDNLEYIPGVSEEAKKWLKNKKEEDSVEGIKQEDKDKNNDIWKEFEIKKEAEKSEWRRQATIEEIDQKISELNKRDEEVTRLINDFGKIGNLELTYAYTKEGLNIHKEIFKLEMAKKEKKDEKVNNKSSISNETIKPQEILEKKDNKDIVLGFDIKDSSEVKKMTLAEVNSEMDRTVKSLDKMLNGLNEKEIEVLKETEEFRNLYNYLWTVLIEQRHVLKAEEKNTATEFKIGGIEGGQYKLTQKGYENINQILSDRGWFTAINTIIEVAKTDFPEIPDSRDIIASNRKIFDEKNSDLKDKRAVVDVYLNTDVRRVTVTLGISKQEKAITIFDVKEEEIKKPDDKKLPKSPDLEKEADIALSKNTGSQKETEKFEDEFRKIINFKDGRNPNVNENEWRKLFEKNEEKAAAAVNIFSKEVEKAEDLNKLKVLLVNSNQKLPDKYLLKSKEVFENYERKFIELLEKNPKETYINDVWDSYLAFYNYAISPGSTLNTGDRKEAVLKIIEQRKKDALIKKADSQEEEKTDVKDGSREGIINELRTGKFRAGEKINNFLRKGEKRNDSKEFDRENLLKFISILNEEIKNTKDIDSLFNMFGVVSDALQYGRIDKDSGNHAATFNSIFTDTRRITGEKLKTLIGKDNLPDGRIREVIKRMFWFKGDYVLDKKNKVSDILNELIQDKWLIKKNK